jgi:hypothetical protein
VERAISRSLEEFGALHVLVSNLGRDEIDTMGREVPGALLIGNGPRDRGARAG